jgi:hypothetical protein
MRSLIILLLMICSQSSLAFFSLMDTGEVKKQDEYRVLGEGQILFDSPEGFNLNGRFATGLNDESEIQFEAGVGSIDFYMGAFLKWVPFPDTSSQPAIGFRGGLTFAQINDYSRYGFNITPLVSKKINSDMGDFSPYSGLILGLQKDVNDTYFSMQLALGLEWSPSESQFSSLQDFKFLLEYGIEIDDAFNYLSFGANYNF